MRPTRTYVLIADAAHAKAFLSTGPGLPLQHVPDLDMYEAVPKAAEVHRHEPASSHPGVGTAHHAVGPASDPHREMKRHFADRVVEALEAARARGAFDRLVIVCPPAMLGDVRKAMPQQLAASVLAELPKDLVKTPTSELLGHFKGIPALVA